MIYFQYKNMIYYNMKYNIEIKTLVNLHAL